MIDMESMSPYAVRFYVGCAHSFLTYMYFSSPLPRSAGVFVLRLGCHDLRITARCVAYTSCSGSVCVCGGGVERRGGRPIGRSYLGYIGVRFGCIGEEKANLKKLFIFTYHDRYDLHKYQVELSEFPSEADLRIIAQNLVSYCITDFCKRFLKFDIVSPKSIRSEILAEIFVEFCFTFGKSRMSNCRSSVDLANVSIIVFLRNLADIS